ncbi:MAG: bacteriocin ABC transporter ATP-binding protein, partial [Elusimicrobia bacterium RIFOXYA2_FULL_40_6]
ITDCAAACLATISKQYGLSISITKIREIAGTDRSGTNAFGVAKAAQALGFNAKTVRGTPEEFMQPFQLPAIAHVIKDNLLHYVVIHSISPKEIIIADPAEGIVNYTPKEFLKIWSGILILLTPAETFQKGDETIGLFKRFFKLILSHKKLLVHIFISSIIYTLLGLIAAFYFKILIDDILADNLKNSLIIFSIGLLLVNIFKLVLNGFRNHLLLYLGQKINVSLILQYYRHVIRLPMSFFDSRQIGEILSRLSDAGKIMSAVSGATFSIMIDTLMVLISAVVLLIYNKNLFFISLAFVPFHMALAWFVIKPFQKVHRKEMENAAKTQSFLVESLSGIMTIKSLNGEERANIETEKRFINYMKTNFKAGWMGNLASSVDGLINSLGEVLILLIGGFYVIEGKLSVGQLITFNALFAYFFGPIKNLINLVPSFQEAYIASDRLGEILDLDSEKQNEHKKIILDKIQGNIEFKGVDFRYGTRNLVLKNINLKINRGERVAIVGESGSGKTTLVKLLLNYYKSENGDILIDGYNIKDINIESLRDRTGYIPQDIFLFSGTIAENISFGVECTNVQEIVEASKKAMAHEFINEMEQRYDSFVGERGATLSGGQKQRIAFARVILKNPDLLVMDEATSNLDTITEKSIQATIKNVSEGKTTIIIAHRLSTIRNCQKIVVMDKGEIKEIGSHEELIKLKGIYSSFWNNQAD